MPNRSRSTVPASPEAPPSDRRYKAFLGQLSEKGRATVARQASSTEGPNSPTWRRLAGRMGALAPHAAEIKGSQAVKFFIPDGKYRQQVFALERGEGVTVVYMPDVLAAAIERRIIEPGKAPPAFVGRDKSHTPIDLEVITADTQNLNTCKGMVGWGRRALRTEIGDNADMCTRLIEQLCALAAESWALAKKSEPVAAAGRAPASR